jgi:hypothetical protein
MNIVSYLKVISEKFNALNISFALAGGLASNLYRKDMRLTADIDIAIMCTELENDIIKNLSDELGQTFLEVREGDLMNLPFRRSRKRTPVQILMGKKVFNNNSITLDLLLESIPWVREGILRAEQNVIKIYDFKIPCLTIEDMIIAKLFAIKNNHRFKDLDDLEQFLSSSMHFDKTYLIGRMLKYQLTIPNEIRKKLKIDPDILRVSREVERGK